MFEPREVVVINQLQPSNTTGVASVILGIVALFCFWIPFVSVPLALLGMLLGLISCFKPGQLGMALAGMAICSIPLAVVAVIALMFAAAATVVTGAAVAVTAAAAQDAADREKKIQEKRRPIPVVAPADGDMPPLAVDNEQPAVEKSDLTEVTDADSARLKAAAVAAAEQESLPKYVPARKRFPGDPYYIRAIIKPGKHTEAEVIEFAKRIIVAADNPTGVVDFFDSDGPLAWSGLMAMNSAAVKQKWLCRVTLTDDNPPVFELGKDKTGKTREDALSGN